MDASILTALGSVVVLLGGMLTIAAYLKKDIQAAKTDLQRDIHRVETNLQGDIHRVEANLQVVKTDLEGDIKEVRTDTRRTDDRVWQLSVLIIKHLGLPPDVLPPAPERQPTGRDQVNA